MFEGLKKRLSSFMGSVAKKERAELQGEAKEEHTELHVQPAVDAAAKTAPEIANTKPKKISGEVETGNQAHKGEPGHETHKKPAESQKKQAQPSAGAAAKIKGMVLGSVKLKEGDIEPFIEALKLGMLESDVNYEVAERLSEGIKREMLSRNISSRDIDPEIRSIIRESIRRILVKGSSAGLIQMIKDKKAANESPFKILFLGPNGAGKTTTIAKIANMLITNQLTCVISASDTFRAAAIEQTSFHADKLGIRAIKGSYGSDPASIAFDAIAHAKAHGIDAVLIDSAGRQETNKSLLEELKKISRVTKPDLKIFIGESIAGNALLGQVKALDEAVKIDGVILTKLDCDAKGGNTLSILSELSMPILFFGTGERYNDIMPYDPDFIIDNIMPLN